MITNNIANAVLFAPLSLNVNELYIVSGYAAPTMLSWYMTNLQGRTQTPIKIFLLVGMVPYDDISLSVHEGFVQLTQNDLPSEVDRLECSYIWNAPAVNSNLIIWANNGNPITAYTGSAAFLQSSYVGQNRQNIMTECDPIAAMEYLQSLIGRSIYANHAEIEEYVTIRPTHPILDRENALINEFNLVQHDGYDAVSLSLITRSGHPGRRSGLNWGQRPGRNPNEAYIPLPARVARSGFFPLEEQHFTVITDDRHQLILRVEQQNDKAITTPARNSDLGEYFRNRLNLANGSPITRADLDRYGRTDVVFLKLDEETYYMDFSRPAQT